MLSKEIEQLSKRMKSILKDTTNHYLIWAYFDLVKDVLTTTGLKEDEGGDGNKYILTMPTGSYDRMSFTIGAIRVLGIGRAVNPEVKIGIVFVYDDLDSVPNRDNWLPWQWSTYKSGGVKGKRAYLTLEPKHLVEYGEVRLKWLESIVDVSATQVNNRVIYHRHRPLIYHVAMDVDLRKLLFRDAGVQEIPSEWIREN